MVYFICLLESAYEIVKLLLKKKKRKLNEDKNKMNKQMLIKKIYIYTIDYYFPIL